MYSRSCSTDQLADISVFFCSRCGFISHPKTAEAHFLSVTKIRFKKNRFIFDVYKDTCHDLETYNLEVIEMFDRKCIQ